MAKLALKGHKTRGKEVIEILEMLGGKNQNIVYSGKDTFHYYFIDNETGYIRTKLYTDDYWTKLTYNIFTLEEFLEKFPYKIGDKVSSKYLKNYKISKMEWESVNNRVIYKLQGMGWYSANELQPYKEETIEESIDKTNKVIFEANAQSCDIMNDIIKEEDMEEKGDKAKAPNLIGEDYSGRRFGYKIPQGYEFDCILNNEIIIKPIKPQYPKSYEECCKAIGCDSKIVLGTMPVRYNILVKLEKLLICRDAYWKIAGKEMGLGKPWEPDWKDDEQFKYIIICRRGCIIRDTYTSKDVILAFPTEEMRDAFYENFKELIEQCKELL